MSLIDFKEKNIFEDSVTGHVRKANEDVCDMAAQTPNGNIFVVCDGMGGYAGGATASKIAAKSIIDYLQREEYPNPQEALYHALEYANGQILDYAGEHVELRGMGTTACVLLLQDDKAWIAHVGDSRIYLFLGKERQLHRITKDHSYVQTLVDIGEITDEQAEIHPQKNCITKALGIKPDIKSEVALNPILPKNGDVFLICSDGLSGMMSDTAIEDVLAKKTSIRKKGRKLIQLALDNGGLDNITVQLIQISNSSHTESVFKSYNPKKVR